MAEFEKIEDLEQLESWLKTNSLAFNQALAARASLRSLPVIMAMLSFDDRRDRGGEVLLAACRAILTAVVSCLAGEKNADIGQASKIAGAAKILTSIPSDTSVHFAASAARFSVLSGRSAAHSAAYALRTLNYAANVSESSRDHQAFTKACREQNVSSHEQLFQWPLWPRNSTVLLQQELYRAIATRESQSFPVAYKLISRLGILG